MFMDDKTVLEVIGIVNHEDDQLIGNTQVAQQNIDNILEFAHPGAKNANKDTFEVLNYHRKSEIAEAVRNLAG